MKAFLSPKELAQAMGVSESSLKRWVDDGALHAVRTPGGHRKIAIGEAVRFIRERQVHVQKPELLGLPALKTALAKPERLGDQLFQALLSDDPWQARGLIVMAPMSGWRLPELFDGPLREALARIGELWQHGAEGIFQEHRAMDTVFWALMTLRQLLPVPPEGAPIALGGGAEDDPYLVPSLMVASVLQEIGFKAINLGPDLPVAVLADAVRHVQPNLVWRSYSVAVDVNLVKTEWRLILDALGPGGRLLLGGQGLPKRLGLQSPKGCVLDSMTQLPWRGIDSREERA